MEHIVRTIGSANELADFVNEGYDDIGEDEEEEDSEEGLKPREPITRASISASVDGQDVTPAMEKLLASSKRASKRWSALSMSDVADKHLREKTDAIADIIRNISEQCAAAVEGLQLANDAAEIDEEDTTGEDVTSSMGGHSREDSGNLSASEPRHGTGHLTPTSDHSSVPPTPDLVHQRSSTALSMASTAPTNYTARESLNQNTGRDRTKIIEDEDAERAYDSASVNGEAAEPSKKHTEGASSSRGPVLSRVMEA